jgi:hypothetical protein
VQHFIFGSFSHKNLIILLKWSEGMTSTFAHKCRPTSIGVQISEKYFQSFYVVKTSVHLKLMDFNTEMQEMRYKQYRA